MTSLLSAFSLKEDLEYMRKAKFTALMQAPTKKIVDGGVEKPLTALEMIEKAEIIYLWLIKDVVG